MSQQYQIFSFPFQFCHRDLDIANMKAVALLLDGLPLPPPESSVVFFFFRYFSLFMELI